VFKSYYFGTDDPTAPIPKSAILTIMRSIMRYYIGLQLPPDLRERIIQAQQALADPALIKPLEPHITLLPPPAVELIDPEELTRQAKLTAEPFWPLQLILTRAETYRDQVIALRVDSKWIHELQKQLVALLPPEAPTTYFPNPVFTPHVTLARARRGQTLPKGLQAHFETRLSDLLPATFQGTRLTLFRWTKDQEYEAITV
jgi:2'-5' RNA ligase